MGKNTDRLGSCCSCGKKGRTVRNIICLHWRAPVPGTGWGCAQCNLPGDGAIAVLCDECLEKKREPKFVCSGYPGIDRRLPFEHLDKTPFDHDLSKHPEELARR